MERVNYETLLPEVEAMLQSEEGHPEGNMESFMDAITAEVNRPTVKGVSIPTWDAFNKAVDGLRPHEFTILCGPTGAGKTTLLANLYALMMASQIPTFAAPVEVGGGSFARAVTSIIAGVHKNAVKGKWKEIDQKHGALFFSNENMLISRYQNRVNHKYLLCDLLHAYRTRGTKIALLDNLNFMMRRLNKGENINDVYDDVIHDWVSFLKHVPIHVWMVMHPKKTDGMRVDSEGDIKGSSTAIQEAQNVILFNRMESSFSPPDGGDSNWYRDLKIAKCRENGRSYGSRVLFSLEKVSEKYEEKGLMK